MAWAAEIWGGGVPSRCSESGGGCGLLTCSQKTHGIPSAARHKVSADSGEGTAHAHTHTHTRTNPGRHAGSHFWKQATPVAWQAHRSPEPRIKAFSILFLSALGSSQSFCLINCWCIELYDEGVCSVSRKSDRDPVLSPLAPYPPPHRSLFLPTYLGLALRGKSPPGRRWTAKPRKRET